jgi:hypothetical protein
MATEVAHEEPASDAEVRRQTSVPTFGALVPLPAGFARTLARWRPYAPPALTREARDPPRAAFHPDVLPDAGLTWLESARARLSTRKPETAAAIEDLPPAESNHASLACSGGQSAG